MRVQNIRNIVIFLTLISISECTSSWIHNRPRGKITDKTCPNDENVYSIPGEYIITVRKGTRKSIIESCLGSLEPIVMKKSVTENMYLVIFKNVADIESVREIASHCWDIVSVRPNYRQRSITKITGK